MKNRRCSLQKVFLGWLGSLTKVFAQAAITNPWLLTLFQNLSQDAVKRGFVNGDGSPVVPGFLL